LTILYQIEVRRISLAGTGAENVPVNKAVENFTKRLNTRVKAGGVHAEYSPHSDWQTVIMLFV